MDWVHCNVCCCQPGKPENRSFFITNCGHIYCKECNDGSMSNCYVCNRDCSSISIESGMKDMELYFAEPEKSIRKQVDVLEFQKSHRMRFFKYLNDKLEKYKELKKEVSSLKDEIKRHREDKNKLKDEVIAKNGEIRKLKMMLSQYQGNLRQPTYSKEHLRSNETFLGGTPRTFGSQLQNTQTFSSLQKAKQNQFTFKHSTDTGSSPTVEKDRHLFTPPPPVSFQNAYRECSSLSLSNTMNHSAGVTSPVSSENLHRQLLHRKVLLPGDKGCSPNRIGLQRLTLKTPSTANSLRGVPSPIPTLGSRVNRTTPSQSISKYNKYM